MTQANMVAGGGGAVPAGAIAMIKSALRGTVRLVIETYRLGGRTIVAAPAIVALAILPELAQHVVEIHLGMFVSRAGFHAHAADPLRMGFGYAKVAGFVLAMLATARFLAMGGSIRGAVAVGVGTLLRLAVAIVLLVAIGLGFDWLATRVPGVAIPLSVVSFILQTGMTLYLVAALLDDRTMTIRRALTVRFPTAVVLTVVMVAAFAPAQALHMADHKLAVGQPAAIVWALMLWDGLFVGLFAALVGAALYVGGTSGASWHGWAR